MVVSLSDCSNPVRGVTLPAYPAVPGAGSEQLAKNMEVMPPQHQSISTVFTNELIGGADMARGQRLPITTELHNDIRDFYMWFYSATEDGVICELEQEEALDRIDRISTDAEYVADSFMEGFSTLRRGSKSKMAVEMKGRVRNKSRAA